MVNSYKKDQHRAIVLDNKQQQNVYTVKLLTEATASIKIIHLSPVCIGDPNIQLTHSMMYSSSLAKINKSK